MGMPRTIPAALTIAGSDCSAGAGAQAANAVYTTPLYVYGVWHTTCVLRSSRRMRLSTLPLGDANVLFQLLRAATSALLPSSDRAGRKDSRRQRQ